MAAHTPSHIGAHLPHEGLGRRNVLVLGGLGAAGLLGARVSATLATGNPRSRAAGPEAGLPTPPAPPAPGTPPQEPVSSGAIGPWQNSTHSTSTPAEDQAAATREGIHLIGDSIATRLLPVLQERLAGRPLSYDVWNGRPTAPALEDLARAVAEDRLAPTVVAVLGSNDIFDPWPFAAQIHRAREIVGGRRLLWVTPFVSRPSARSADLRNSAVLGLALERAAAAGQIELVRWFELLARSADRVDDLAEDGVHPTGVGSAALADLVLTTLG